MFSSKALRFTCIALFSAALVLSSCKKKKEEEVTPTEEETPAFRPTKVDYSLLTSTTPYNNDLFKDSNGDTTVDRNEGRNLNRMIVALGAEARKGNAAVVSANLLSNMYFNAGSPFSGSYSDLNSLNISLYKATATTSAYRDDRVTEYTSFFNTHSTASNSFASTATAGNAGVLVNGASVYLVDTLGLEGVQLIQKSMIGGIQLDYIGNYLLGVGLNADNSKLVEGKKYTALEHNWDVAFGLFSLNNVLYAGYTNSTKPSVGAENLLGSYVWEYNKDAYAGMHLAFLKGRAAIINGDMNEVRAQADFIRRAMERAIAAASVGYLKKWSDNTGSTEADEAIRVHAIGEGVGFINSLRFCYLTGGTDAFAATQLTTLGVFTGNGYWDLTTTKVNTASTAIKTKFGLL